MTTLTIEIPDKDTEFVKQVLKKLHVKIVAAEKSSYNPEFVAKIKKSEENFKEGKFTTIKVEDLWK